MSRLANMMFISSGMYMFKNFLRLDLISHNFWVYGLLIGPTFYLFTNLFWVKISVPPGHNSLSQGNTVNLFNLESNLF